MARMTRAESEDRPAGRLRIRILLAAGEPFGPGKAELLEAIRDTGSIAAAGRRMGMSYQRAWDLVAAMNAHFREPVVAAAKGGARGVSSFSKKGIQAEAIETTCFGETSI